MGWKQIVPEPNSAEVPHVHDFVYACFDCGKVEGGSFVPESELAALQAQLDESDWQHRKLLAERIAAALTTTPALDSKSIRNAALEEAAKVAEVCTCGSGPELRAMHMRYHAASCSVHTATMIRALLTTTPAASMPTLPYVCSKCGVQQHADGICANCGSLELRAQPPAASGPQTLLGKYKDDPLFEQAFPATTQAAQPVLINREDAVKAIRFEKYSNRGEDVPDSDPHSDNHPDYERAMIDEFLEYAAERVADIPPYPNAQPAVDRIWVDKRAFVNIEKPIDAKDSDGRWFVTEANTQPSPDTDATMTVSESRVDPSLPTHCDHGVSLDDPCYACRNAQQEG